MVRFTNHTRARVPDHEDAVYDPALLCRRFRVPANVRFRLCVDIKRGSTERPVLALKML